MKARRYNPLASAPTPRTTRPVTQADPAAALSRAQTQESEGNYPTIYEGFMAKGIPREAIQPRVNVLTFNAWRAKGRIVKKGQHGVRIVGFAPLPDKTKVDPTSGQVSVVKRQRRFATTVFHESQTEALIDTTAIRPRVAAPAAPAPQPLPVAFTPAAPAQPVAVVAPPPPAPSNIVPLPKANWRERFYKRG